MAAQYSKAIALGHRKIYNYRLNNAGSGLTNYKLIMGINALDNIKYIGNNLKIKSEKIENAVRWHIWKNYNFVLKLIIATNGKKANKNLYKTCKKQIKSNMIKVAIKSELAIKEKIKIIFISCFPCLFAKIKINQEKKALKKDIME